MKYQGKSIEVATTVVVVIPIGEQEIVFEAKPVRNIKDFENTWKAPEAPIVQYPNRAPERDEEDTDYKKAYDEWTSDRFYWMQLQSISATVGLEFETVDMKDPKTFKNFVTELQEYIGTGNTNRVLNIIREALGLNQDKVDEATARFLLSREKARVSGSSPSGEHKNTPSGEPVNVG